MLKVIVHIYLPILHLHARIFSGWCSVMLYVRTTLIFMVFLLNTLIRNCVALQFPLL